MFIILVYSTFHYCYKITISYFSLVCRLGLFLWRSETSYLVHTKLFVTSSSAVISCFREFCFMLKHQLWRMEAVSLFITSAASMG
ncbi:hypothetical protein QL285_092373 [Trifolium repens]|nr:hypothetical protein QL285_092373 [Trifolium repens]